MNEKSLVLWESNLGYTAGTKYTKYVFSIINLPNDIKSIIVGIILSDGNIAFNSKAKNAYLILNQSLAKSAYIYFVFSFLSHYCKSYPKLSISYRLSRPSYVLIIATRSIYISKKYIIPLQKIVLPYMHRSMFYKLGIK